MRKVKDLRQKFIFYYQIIKYRIVIFLILNLLVTLLDGIGIAMFIPIISSSNNFTLEKASTILGNFSFLLSIAKLFNFQSIQLLLLILIITTFIIKGIIRTIQIRYTAQIRYITITYLRSKLLTNYQKLSYTGYTQINSEKIHNTITTEVGRIFNNLTNFLLTIQNFVMLATYLTLILIFDPKFAIIATIITTISNIFYNRIIKSTEKSSELVTAESHKFNGLLQQTNINFKYLKSTNKLNYFILKLKESLKYIENLNLKMGHELSIIEGIKEPLAVLSICIIIYVQGIIFSGATNIILLNLILFYKVLLHLNQLKSSWQSFNQTTASIKAIKEINSHFIQFKEKVMGDIKLSTINQITLKNISLAYSDKIILDKINLEINKNQIIAFVGESGVGKTSLINLITNLIPSKSGKLCINNININNIDTQSYRNKIGYITQDPVIFNDTIFNNITLFSEKNSRNLKKFWEVIKLVSLYKFTQNLEKSLDTKLGDNGTLISGGQKQRIAIAREIFKEIELLIMDEATSALNYELENTIKENLYKLRGKMTIIIIAHRITTIKDADKIYLIHNKTITESGTYTTLINKSQIFKKMVDAQY